MRARALRGAIATIVAVTALVACAQPPVDEAARPRHGSNAAGDSEGRAAVAWAPPEPPADQPQIETPAPAQAASPAVDATEPAVPAAPAPAAPASAAAPPAPPPVVMPGGFTLNRNGDGSTVRWDPCRPVRWRANTTLAPPGALDTLAESFDRLSAATGITFQYGGATLAIPDRAWLEGGADTGSIVVAWAPKGTSDLWSGTADGEGGWYTRGLSRDGVSWSWRIERGFVLIDPASTAGYLDGFGTGVTLGALLLHELAHAVGLGHVDDPAQLMHPTLNSDTAARYGDGDLAGLAQVGRAAGCIG